MKTKEPTKLSRLAHSLQGSQILELSRAVKKQIEKGSCIQNLTVGDFDPSIFPIPAALKKEIIKAYQEDFTNYPAAEGNADLRAAIAAFVSRWHDLQYDPSEVLVASGGRPLIYAAYRAVCDQNEKVVYAVPSWNNNYYTHFVGGSHVAIHASPENGFLPTAEDLRPHVKSAVLVSLCSPQNPTGTVYTKEQLQGICVLILEENSRRRQGVKKCYLLYDQMYALLSYGVRHYDPVSVRPEMRPYTIYIDAISKAFAATGVRVGWSLGPAPVLEKMKNILTHMGAWAPMAEQKALARYLSDHEIIKEYLGHFKTELSERLERMYEGIQEMKRDGLPVDAIEPRAGIYLSVKIEMPGFRIADAVSYLLEQAGLAVLPFYVFGASDEQPWFRISVGTCRQEQIPQILENLRRALENYRHCGNKYFSSE